MKTALTFTLGAAIALMSSGLVSSSAEARSWKKKHWQDGYDRRWQRQSRRRRFTRRELNTLPIHITRPPGTGHYVFDDYPAWAARAFQPHFNR